MQEDEKVQEVPGLYGTFAMEERMIQQIWNENSILPQNLKTIDDIHLQILKPGKWNLAEEGPDFKDASISLDGKVIHGDIEIHFEEKDWWAHGHEQDPAYKKVILHVISNWHCPLMVINVYLEIWNLNVCFIKKFRTCDRRFGRIFLAA